jgi:hypothetical protein
VAADAADPAVYMHRVVKVSKIRDLMDSDPVHRLTRFPALPYRPEFRIVILDLLVAIHARLGRRDVRGR